MLKLVIISSNKKNVEGYKNLIDLVLLKTKEAYKIYCFENYSNDFNKFLNDNNGELIYLLEESDENSCEQLFKLIRLAKGDIRSFVIVADFNKKVSDIIKDKYFINSKFLTSKSTFNTDFKTILELLFSSYKGKKKTLKFIYNNCIYRINFRIYSRNNRNRWRSCIRTYIIKLWNISCC
jgi:hypothetical protein